ncbi:MAG: hypothetical protein JW863_16260 [Chitinispirillaceae bacterium]|nr:hypothetical protein [Chitinispirillaceae bacterium]
MKTNNQWILGMILTCLFCAVNCLANDSVSIVTIINRYKNLDILINDEKQAGDRVFSVKLNRGEYTIVGKYESIELYKEIKEANQDNEEERIEIQTPRYKNGRWAILASATILSTLLPYSIWIGNKNGYDNEILAFSAIFSSASICFLAIGVSYEIRYSKWKKNRLPYILKLVEYPD